MPNRFDSALATGAALGWGNVPSAICVAFHNSSVVTIDRIVSRIRSASPMCEPRNRSGFCTLRM